MKTRILVMVTGVLLFFNQQRAMGAFLVSAKMENGKVVQITVKSEKGGKLYLQKLVGEGYGELDDKKLYEKEGVLTIEMKPGETLHLSEIH